MSRRFQTTYGHFGASADAASTTKGFQLTPEAQEGIVSLVAVGTGLAQKAIETEAAKKRAKAKPKSKKKKAAAPTAAAVAAAAPTESTGISTQTLAIGAGAFLLVGGLAWYMNSKKKAGADVGDV